MKHPSVWKKQRTKKYKKKKTKAHTDFHVKIN